MKTVINKTNKLISFPALAIAFSPKESKIVTDEIAHILNRDAAIYVQSIRAQSTIPYVGKPLRKHKRTR